MQNNGNNGYNGYNWTSDAIDNLNRLSNMLPHNGKKPQITIWLYVESAWPLLFEDV
jgi:hypothetical protein